MQDKEAEYEASRYISSEMQHKSALQNAKEDSAGEEEEVASSSKQAEDDKGDNSVGVEMEA